MKKRKLKRDVVISIIRGKDMVGLYFQDKPKEVIAEFITEKANAIIKLWDMPQYLFENGEWKNIIIK